MRKGLRGRNCGVNTSAAKALNLVQATQHCTDQMLNGFCHGDDFVIAAAEDGVENFGNLLLTKFETRLIGKIGAAEHLDKELEVLHRFVRVINSETGRSRTHSRQHGQDSEGEAERN